MYSFGTIVPIKTMSTKVLLFATDRLCHTRGLTTTWKGSLRVTPSDTLCFLTRNWSLTQGQFSLWNLVISKLLQGTRVENKGEEFVAYVEELLARLFFLTLFQHNKLLSSTLTHISTGVIPCNCPKGMCCSHYRRLKPTTAQIPEPFVPTTRGVTIHFAHELRVDKQYWVHKNETRY